MSRINEFKPCPICGRSDALDMVDGKIFHRAMQMFNHRGVVWIECTRCELQLMQSVRKDTSWNYDILVGELKKKWEKLH